MGQTTSLKQAETAVQEHTARVVAAHEELAAWQVKASQAREELEQAEANVGVAALDAEDGGEAVSRRLRELRDRVAVTTAAEQEQSLRVPPVEAAYLGAVADLLEVRDLAPAVAALEQHTAATARLVADLEKLEGVSGTFVPHYAVDTGAMRIGESYRVAKVVTLTAHVRRAERQRTAVRDLAAGAEPVPGGVAGWSEEDFPVEVWGPDALVPAQGFVARRAAAARQHEDSAAAAAELDRDVDAAQAALDHLEAQIQHVEPGQRERYLRERRQAVAAAEAKAAAFRANTGLTSV